MNVIRSSRHKLMVSLDDTPVRLIKGDKIFEPMYMNNYGKVYYYYGDDIIFMNDEALHREYKIEIINN